MEKFSKDCSALLLDIIPSLVTLNNFSPSFPTTVSNKSSFCSSVILEIEKRYDYIKFLEIGIDNDHVHFLIQSTPNYSPSQIVKIIKSITARQIFVECPQVKKKLWGGQFWTDGYFVATVGKNQNESVIKEYVKNQGKQDAEYRQLHLNLRGIAQKDTP